jgi:signal transduction histidine kinase
MIGRDTLRWRLAAASSAWIVVTLLVCALALIFFFRDHIERRFDGALADHLEELIAASEAGADGALALSWRPFDPRFNRPRSGWYWQILQDGRAVARSDSLWRSDLPVASATGGPGAVREFTGPTSKRLRAVEQVITLPRSPYAFVYTVAGPVSDIDADVRRFTVQIATAMALLAVGLLLAVIVQVRFGLRPLLALRGALSAVRAGQAVRLEGEFPAEVRPLADELNSMLERNAAMLERARAHAADLAHALKNPLAVIINETRSIPGTSGDVLRREAAAMTGAIDRHLSRARAAGGQGRPGQRTEVAGVVEDLRYSLERLYRERGLSVEIGGPIDQVFPGDRQDLEEMLGNLMDNAFKWAARRVVVSATMRDGRLLLRVEDDGPGLPDEKVQEALARGRRLDESTPGTGMGLAIVRDLAETYGGGIELAASGLGGLRATLVLPGAGNVTN